MLGLNSGLGTRLEKLLDTLVPERLDHAYSVTYHDTHVKSYSGHLGLRRDFTSYLTRRFKSDGWVCLQALEMMGDFNWSALAAIFELLCSRVPEIRHLRSTPIHRREGILVSSSPERRETCRVGPAVS
jgi:hypothetical protein